MRRLTPAELNQANGGFTINQAQSYVTNNIIKPLASGGIFGMTVALVFERTNIGKYAVAYGLGAAASAVGMTFINQVI